MRRVDMQSVIDNVHRASRAARTAQKLAASAAKAFAAEATNLGGVASSLENIVAMSEVGM